MNFRFLLFILTLLTVASFAETTLTTDTPKCNASFNDSTNVRVLDALNRPIPGAGVTASFQYTGSVGVDGKGTFHTIGPFITNSSGITHLYIKNTETSESKVDCKINISATIANTTGKIIQYANAHGDPVDVQVNVYPILFYVRDQRNSPIQNAKISVGTMDGNIGETGYAVLYAPVGRVSYLVSYLDGKQTGSLNITGDTTYAAVLSYHSISVDIVDDSGSPLPASIFIFNKSTQLGPDGHYSMPDVFGNEIQFSATYKGVTKDITMFPEVENTTRVVFDFHSPTIANVTQIPTEGTVRLFVTVFDPGAYPSGVDPSTIEISYRTESGTEFTEWTKASAYALSKDNFAVDFPFFAPNSIVKFKIDASDREGNKATVSGSFTVVPPTAPAANNTITPPQPDKPGSDDYTILYLAGGVVIILLIALVVLRMKKGGD